MFYYSYNFFFKGKSVDKILHIGVLFLLSLAGDTLALCSFTLVGYSLNELSKLGLLNSIATVLSKIILFLTVRVIFDKTKKLNYEMIPIIFATFVMELPCIGLFNRMSLINNNDSFLLIFILSQIAILGVVVYVMHILRKKREKEEELIKWKRDMEMQLRGSEGAEETLNNLRMLRHDMKQHVGIIKSLLDEENYEQARRYLDRVYQDVDVAGEYFTLKNRSVSITLTLLKQMAKSKKVNFYTKIMTEEFLINDIDICAIISNVGRNAIEAAEQSQELYCKLVITAQKEGYRIFCENTYKGDLIIKKGSYKTTKGDGHGQGINIIRKIVSKNNGKASFSGKNGVFVVDIFIPGGDAYDAINTV